MTMDEYEKRFFELLKYVGFIKDEKVKIQRFLSGLPSFYSDKIQYDNPRTLEEGHKEGKAFYEQNKGRPTFQKAWDDKRKEIWIKERKDSSHLSSGTTLKHINKDNQHRVSIK
jgi:hypothetical protein